ncbi:phosphatidylinositol 3 and 4-kinase-domain-containing protein [Fennellomyces sp. T-0311]|nr:phosphatidylinositol 3 and 4-kinase-domain-containing protein [Fennellomyces sp. T-0311]
MFTRARHMSASSAGQGYTRLQQQDDFDDEYDDLIAHTSIERHPNSLIVASNYHSAVVPQLPKANAMPNDLAEEAAASTASIPEDEEVMQSFSARASMSAKRAAEIPIATQRFIRSKLPFRKTTATEASFASLPKVIMADIQQGDMPSQADPTLKELSKRGWTIVRRRRLRGRRRMLGNKKHVRGELTPLSFDNTLAPTDQLSTSVFVKWDPASSPTDPAMQRPASPPFIRKDIPVSKEEFESVVQSVRSAIDNAGVQPTRISQGSSGSYFCRDRSGKIVGVFKPKNEEPYGRLNPKWTKWIHRHLFPCCFGRSCLIPNLGYISEAASSLIDRRLGTCLVPHTDVVHLASSSFHYDYLDRRSAAVVGLPPKIGSFQCFLDGFRDANLFLRDHPYPVDHYSSSSLVRGSSVWAGCMGQQDEDDNDYASLSEGQEMYAEAVADERYDSDQTHIGSRAPYKKGFKWTHRMQDQFKMEFEQLVILDYLIRNTDRGLDNWMIKYCHDTLSGSSSPTTNGSLLDSYKNAYIQLAAIDNGLAFPFKHPDQWRSYPYGWLALPEPLIARPFSESTRHQFLSVLSDPVWWRETVRELRELFKTDSDFDERMFQRQMAVLKGQGFNIVRALSDPNATPMDLVATERVLVNQEEILIEYDERLIQKRSPQQKQSPRRLKTKRSTSFDLSMHQASSAEMIPPPPPQLEEEPLPWSDRLRSRMSLDLGRRRRRRLIRNLRLGRHVGSDGENDSSSDSEDEKDTRKRVTIIMETIEVVKSRAPYFTCC